MVTPLDRHSSLLTLIAAQLEIARADQALQRSKISLGGTVSPNTVRNVLKARDHRITTLVDVADALNLDITIHFHKRPA